VAPGEQHSTLAYVRGSLALGGSHDPAVARAFAAEGRALAHEIAWVDGEMMCLALEGLALVAAGDVDEGMRRLDDAAAAAVAGAIADARLAEVVCCHLIDACKRVRDFRRAGEWCARVEEMAVRYGDAGMIATCRIHHGDVLVSRGDWNEAERALTAACRESTGVGRRVLDGLVRLAELRRRQGRVEEARALVAEAELHPRAGLVRAALALDAREPARAADEVERLLRRLGERDRLERAAPLELLVRAELGRGRDEAAERPTAELERLAAAVGTPALRAAAVFARGRLQRSRGSADAAPSLEGAADLFSEADVPYEAAQARLELARALHQLGRGQDADRAARRAQVEFSRIGATRSRDDAAGRTDEVLTPREREILRLLALGSSNEEIAERLAMSVPAVESHIADVYAKIGASGGTARAAATAYALSHEV
jgi:ATP/maltotriose-dependent transcriptional regulator MalT